MTAVTVHLPLTVAVRADGTVAGWTVGAPHAYAPDGVTDPDAAAAAQAAAIAQVTALAEDIATPDEEPDPEDPPPVPTLDGIVLDLMNRVEAAEEKVAPIDLAGWALTVDDAGALVTHPES